MLVFLYFVVAAGLLFAVLRLTCGPCVMGYAEAGAETLFPRSRLPVITLGWTLSLFLTVTYVLCVGFDLIFPGYAMYEAWIALLPGVTWLSWSSFVLGLAWAFFYGWYIAFLFGGLFNAIAAQN
ncbi:hypothetical protein O2N63_17020 [Aliiroseovarius sp. KMU-50]|uniref:Uncharacterized protein n=1 Tax=Aliiroseovarius salicola TaxID=3009082 RepID=A0ABT4W5Q3_9RHOB|nr:hypothetical protein [Aliiroseovarius sp. KMU-50]MDA5095795.1 hypothetical protein [Aliiroseovarius sp. KMU-50]